MAIDYGAKNNILRNLASLGFKVTVVPAKTKAKDILKKIKLLGYSRILLESGLKLTTNFLRENLIDDFYIFVSNKKLGINGRNNFKNNMKLFFNNKKFSEEKVNLFGDRLISYRIK